MIKKTMTKIKITPEVIMKHTAIGKHVTNQVFRHLQNIILLIYVSIHADRLYENSIISNLTTNIISIVLIIIAIKLLIESKTVAEDYYSIRNRVYKSLIIEKKPIKTIILTSTKSNERHGVVVFKQQEINSCYIIDEDFEMFEGALEAYQIDIINNNGRVGIGALPINKYTL